MSQNWNFEDLENDEKLDCIWINENKDEDKIVCDICKEKECLDDDEIVICSLCLVGVHQSCYGRDIAETVPDGDWLC